MRSLNKQVLSVLFILSFFIASCSTIKTRRDLDQPNTTGKSGGPVDVTAGTQTQNQDEEIPAPPVEPTPPSQVIPLRPRVGIILGPGGMRAMAHAGVLHELHKQRIPIDAIAGIEWGALVASLYASQGAPNGVDWKLFKLKREMLPQKGFFKNSLSTIEINTLDPYLKDSFEKQKIEDFKVPFACPSLSTWSSGQVLHQRGEVNGALKRCLPYPPIYKSSTPWVAGGFGLSELTDWMKAQRIELVIVVNVIADGELMKQQDWTLDPSAAILWSELKRAMMKMGATNSQGAAIAIERVDVPLKDISLIDFDRRQAIAQMGSQVSGVLQTMAKKYGF
jgi:NTE family protein